MANTLIIFIALILMLANGWVIYGQAGSLFDEFAETSVSPEHRASNLRWAKFSRAFGFSMMLFAWTVGVVVVTLLVVGGTVH